MTGWTLTTATTSSTSAKAAARRATRARRASPTASMVATTATTRTLGPRAARGRAAKEAARARARVATASDALLSLWKTMRTGGGGAAFVRALLFLVGRDCGILSACSTYQSYRHATCKLSFHLARFCVG